MENRVYVTCFLDETGPFMLNDALNKVDVRDHDVNHWHNVIKHNYDIGSGQDKIGTYYLAFAKLDEKIVDDKVAQIVHNVIQNATNAEGPYYIKEVDGYTIDILWWWMGEE